MTIVYDDKISDPTPAPHTPRPGLSATPPLKGVGKGGKAIAGKEAAWNSPPFRSASRRVTLATSGTQESYYVCNMKRYH